MYKYIHIHVEYMHTHVDTLYTSANGILYGIYSVRTCVCIYSTCICMMCSFHFIISVFTCSSDLCFSVALESHGDPFVLFHIHITQPLVCPQAGCSQ